LVDMHVASVEDVDARDVPGDQVHGGEDRGLAGGGYGDVRGRGRRRRRLQRLVHGIVLYGVIQHSVVLRGVVLRGVVAALGGVATGFRHGLHRLLCGTGSVVAGKSAPRAQVRVDHGIVRPDVVR